MATTDTTIDTLGAIATAFAAMIGGAGVLTPAVIAAIVAGSKAIADHATGTIDSTTAMAAVTSTDAEQVQDNKDADAYEASKLKP
jgi:uncharacterized membrane protein